MSDRSSMYLQRSSSVVAKSFIMTRKKKWSQEGTFEKSTKNGQWVGVGGLIFCPLISTRKKSSN